MIKSIVASAFSLITVSAGSLASVPAWSADSVDAVKPGTCEPWVVSAQTHFPSEAQARGEGGVVRVQVLLDKDGRVVRSEVARSSGSRLLDRAAQESVNTAWRFDVSHCAASALPVTQEVSVVYRRVPKLFSVSINRRGLEYTKQATANDQCTVVPTDKATNVISCIQRPTPGGSAAAELATR